MPISQPKPNSPPSVKRVEEFTYTAALSTLQVNCFCAFSSLFVIGDKVVSVGVKYVLAGNGAYIIGLVLFAIGAKKKYFHTIFHIFVIIGVAIHFINLYKYVFV